MSIEASGGSLSCFGKKGTKEADIGEALTAKPIGYTVKV